MNTLQVRKNKAGYEYRTDFMPWQYGGTSFEAAVKSASARVTFNKVIDMTEVTVELFRSGRRASMTRYSFEEGIKNDPMIGRLVAIDGQEIVSDSPF